MIEIRRTLTLTYDREDEIDRYCIDRLTGRGYVVTRNAEGTGLNAAAAGSAAGRTGESRTAAAKPKETGRQQEEKKKEKEKKPEKITRDMVRHALARLALSDAGGDPVTEALKASTGKARLSEVTDDQLPAVWAYIEEGGHGKEG